MLSIDDRYLIVADLHLGVEEEYYKKGVHILNQEKVIYNSIKEELDKNKYEKLFILGDVKHSIQIAGFYERNKIYNLFKELSKLLEVHIVLGNHDGGIEKIVPENIYIHGSEGILVYKKYGLFHGHRWPNLDLFKSEVLISGHRHANIKIVDKFGIFHFQKVWLEFDVSIEKMVDEYIKKKGKVEFDEGLSDKKLILVPAFSDILSGREIKKSNLHSLGPILSSKIINKNKGDVFLLDNTYLGRVDEILDDK